MKHFCQGIYYIIQSKKKNIFNKSPQQMSQLQDFNSDMEIEYIKRRQVPVFHHPRFMNQIRIRHRTKKRNSTKRKTYRSKIDQLQVPIQMNKKITMTYKNIQVQEGLEKKTVYIHGNKIDGTWKNGSLHGNIIIQYQSGQYFEGQYSHGIRVQGKVIFKDGTEYFGSFLKDLFHGKGSLKDPSGRIISCEWQQGQPSNKAKIQYPSGDMYFGQIKCLKKHGNGHLFFKNGAKYVGGFIDGAITGYGSYYQNNQKIAEGVWKNGVLQVQENIRQVLLETFKMQQELGIKKPINNFHSGKKVLFESVLNQQSLMLN